MTKEKEIENFLIKEYGYLYKDGKHSVEHDIVMYELINKFVKPFESRVDWDAIYPKEKQDVWYEWLAGNGEISTEIACYITDSFKELRKNYIQSDLPEKREMSDYKIEEHEGV